jgi:hypothetical protein
MDYAGVLPGREVRPFSEAAWKQISALAVAEPGEPFADSGAGLLCDLELHRPTGLLLDHGRSVPHPPAGTHVVNFQPDEIAASQLAVGSPRTQADMWSRCGWS